MAGKTNWFFPDAELPPPGQGQLKGHESVIILNPNASDARVSVTLYYEAGTSPQTFDVDVAAESVRCLRTNNKTDMGGLEIPFDTQYALALRSSVPVIAQYGRLDNRQTNLAYYTTPGYSE